MLLENNGLSINICDLFIGFWDFLIFAEMS